MATPYPVKLSILLKPVQHASPLKVKIGIDGNLTTVDLSKPSTITFEFVATDTCTLTVELLDRQDQEAVIIEQVDFFGISDPRFAWAGVYEPCYPEPWATEQRSQGVVLKPQLCPYTYLGWSGKWTLTFSVPVFTWIHKTQNLGWIYG
jgi:hypothetical protein